MKKQGMPSRGVPRAGAVKAQNKAAKTYIQKGPKSPARVEAGKRAMASIKERATNKGRAQGAVIGGTAAAAVSVAEKKKKTPSVVKPALKKLAKKP